MNDIPLWQSYDGYAPTEGERVIHLPADALLEIRNRATKNICSTGYVIRFKQLDALAVTYDERTIQYTYDGFSRLLQADYDNDDRVYDYNFDLAGNRLQETLSGTGVTAKTTDYEYNTVNQVDRMRVDASAGDRRFGRQPVHSLALWSPCRK